MLASRTAAWYSIPSFCVEGEFTWLACLSSLVSVYSSAILSSSFSSPRSLVALSPLSAAVCLFQNGQMQLATLQSQFPSARGLKYRSLDTSRFRAVRASTDGQLIPPPEGWTDYVFLVVTG